VQAVAQVLHLLAARLQRSGLLQPAGQRGQFRQLAFQVCGVLFTLRL